MKNETSQKEIQRINLALCSKGNEAVMVCSSQKCKNSAFVCNDKKCSCRPPHKLCLELSIEKIHDIILSHSCELKPFEEKIQAIFNEAIDKISDERDSLLSEIKLKYQKLGLSQLENKFLTALTQRNHTKQINCQFVWKLLAQIDKQEEENNQKDFGFLEKSLIKLGKELNQQIQGFSNKFKILFEEINKEGYVCFSKSEIVKKVDDQEKIKAFFIQNPIQSTKLLYRASQNEFLASKFYEKCQKIQNTITIVETEHGKIVGGFSSQLWYKPQNGGEYVYIPSEDNKIENFLFSVSNNQKLTLKKENKQHSICLCDNDNWGPRFGGGHDLAISNKAHQNTSSYASAHTYAKPHSDVNFTGARNFKVKEWEVWAVSFKE